MKNPGYLIRVKERTQLRASLLPLDLINTEIPSVSVCVFEILSKNRYRIYLEDDSYASRSWGYHTPVFELEPNKHGYLLLCINFEREVNG